jgi:small-conductance mechanosensitive channel
MRISWLQIQASDGSGEAGDAALPHISELAEAAAREAGEWASQPLVHGITAMDLLLFLTVALVASVLDALQRYFIRHRLKVREAGSAEDEAEHEKESRLWIDLALEVARAPVSLVIWVYALYLGSFALLRSWRLADPAHPLLQLLDWLAALWGFVVLLWFIARLAKVVDLRLNRRAQRSGSRAERILVPVVGRALRLLLPLLVIAMALPLFEVSPQAAAALRTAASIALIAAVTLVLVQVVLAFEEAILAEFKLDTPDNLAARKVYTQVSVLKKLALVILGVVALASALMVFEPVRQLGASMLASAGIAGIVIGFAAQRSLGTMVAGIQIALTQPIRIDDVVIVEGEWGRIEEITLTYVVVRIWDLRRLIVPINHFIERPFQNWTRTSAELLGSVFLYLDYSVPVDALRAEVDRLLEGHPKWDRKVKAVQVTDARERVIEVRILASAADAGSAFDLRCHLREKLIFFIQQNYPDALPRFRAELNTQA